MKRPDPDVPRWESGNTYDSWRPFTVGALRRIIEGMADDVHVVIESDDWYDNVRTVCAPPLNGYPDPEDEIGSEWQCLTLFSGATFDARQI